MNFDFDEEEFERDVKIKVVGVGGGGGNAVENMVRNNVEGVDFIIINTDVSALKAKDGSTDADKEREIKTKGYTKEKWNDVGNGMDKVLSLFADCKNEGNTEDSEKAQSLVKKLQDYITENFYTCTDEILAGLGQTYVYDERFKNNIDKLKKKKDKTHLYGPYPNVNAARKTVNIINRIYPLRKCDKLKK